MRNQEPIQGGHLQETEKVLAQGTPQERKQVVRAWVQEVQLAPETLQVDITYRIPEPVVNSVGAGVGFEPTTFGL